MDEDLDVLSTAEKNFSAVTEEENTADDELAIEEELKREGRRKFYNAVYEEIFLQQEAQIFLNDVEIHCQDGKLRAPAMLLAVISPLFKATAPIAPDIVENPSLVLPDTRKEHLELFLKYACIVHSESIPVPLEHMEMIESVMDTLCLPFKGSDDPVDALFLLDQDWPPDIVNTRRIKEENKENEPKMKKKVGRKPGQKLNIKQEPYIKTEVTDSHRYSEQYGLRSVIKRKRFTDEISEPSDLDIDDYLEIEDYGDSADEYAPDETEVNTLEEESETDEEMDEEYGEEDLDSPNEDELFDSDDEIIDMSNPKKNTFNDNIPKGLESFTVKINAQGDLETISSLEPLEDLESQENKTPKPRGRPRKKPKIAETNTQLVAIGRVISVMEDEDHEQLAFKGKKIYAAVKANPRSLLKSEQNDEEEENQQKPIPLILFCSVCEAQFEGQAELKHHVAKNHKDSKFFKLAKNNPHRDCVKCAAMMKSFEETIERENPQEFSQKDICFPCPHCRRRYLGHLGGLTSHLINDHRSHVSPDLEDKPESYYRVLRRSDSDEILICDFCTKRMPHTTALNKHLIACTSNDSGISAGLFCHICGKMFAQHKYLKDHLARHGKDQIQRQRNYLCPYCPVACVSEGNLAKHLEREHSNKDPDEDFILHENCQRCSAMFASYMENKISKSIAFRDMVFKCPHCCMVLYANHKHAPRYLHNHINKFHTDPEINDFSLGDLNDPTEFRLRSKQEPNVLTCEFCGFASKSRSNHNVHLSTCKQSTVPCRPGYMCDTCGFIAGTAVHLRNHLETHNDPRTFECDQCDYTGRSKRYLMMHIKNHHTEEGQRRRLEGPSQGFHQVSCPNCGKLKRDGSSLRAHLKKCGSGPPKVNCPHCNMEFKRPEDMKAHFLIHKGVILCPVHNILFQEESEVYQHFNTAEPEEKFPKLECCICGKSFKHMCLFMKHLRKELRILPYRCNICQKHVNTYASLQLHMKRLHSDEKIPPREKTHKCDQCGKLFMSRGHLTEHVNGVHNRGSTSVPCPVCHKNFNTIKRMKKHLFNAHKETAEEFRNASQPFSILAI